MRVNGHNPDSARRLGGAFVLLLSFAPLLPVAANAAPWANIGPAHDDPTDAELLALVVFDQNLDAQMPLAAPLRDEQGRAVSLGDYLGAKPAILVFTYYRCPNLCPVILHGLTESLRTLRMAVGGEYDVIVVSIDPRETPEDATATKVTAVGRYGRFGTQGGWHFLTGEEASIARLADAAGFHYAYDAKTDQYAHPSGLLLLTSAGKISKYFYGLEYSPRDLKLGLVDASAGKIGSAVDKLLLRCFHYDPEQGRYTVAVMNLVKAGGALTVGALAGTILVLTRRKPGRPGPDAERAE